jgi:hypothetical protein
VSTQDRALVLLVVVALAVGGAAWWHRRAQQLLEVAERIDPCDPEAAVQHKARGLGAPSADAPGPDGRVLSWTRSGRRLSVVLVKSPSRGELVVGVVRVTTVRPPGADDEGPPPVYEDRLGLQRCR